MLMGRFLDSLLEVGSRSTYIQYTCMGIQYTYYVEHKSLRTIRRGDTATTGISVSATACRERFHNNNNTNFERVLRKDRLGAF